MINNERRPANNNFCKKKCSFLLLPKLSLLIKQKRKYKQLSTFTLKTSYLYNDFLPEFHRIIYLNNYGFVLIKKFEGFYEF